MGKYRKAAIVVATVATLSGSLAACGTSSAGGTLQYLMKPTWDHLDPQRMYVGQNLATANRMWERRLVSFGATNDANPTLVADLATDTGKSSNGLKTWAFTLKDGVKWQDGKDVTCADLKYGLSRGFATDVITGGPNYALSFLDVPLGPKGLPMYDGPYKKDNQADFDKAVTCDGKTITYRFNKPWPDFPQAIAALAEFSPYRADQDHGDASNYAVFSDGPYKLQGAWNQNTGGTFVRNDKWDSGTDTIRKALPDKIVITTGIATATIFQRLIADNGDDKAAITERRVPPALYGQITGDAVTKRATTTVSPYTDYLMPNVNRMTNLKVRQALAMATDTGNWINEGGADKAFVPAYDIVNPAVKGHQDLSEFKSKPANGDIAGAKALLQQAGVPLPYPLKFTYQSLSPVTDKQAAALKAAWDQAGFNTTLDPQTDKYYPIIQKPNSDSDVVWAGWGADWPSISTVIPPLFDSRINLTPTSNGQDYGNYKSDAVNALIDKAAQATSASDQISLLQQADKLLADDVAYIPLESQIFYRLHGSKITGYQEDPATNGYVDLANIGVSK